jgi:hypothetical protein
VKGKDMSDQILAVFKNVLKPRGPDVDAGDLVLTAQRLCFVQLADWAPNVNANPLLTAVAGTVGGFGAAAVTTIGSVARQKPEIVKLLASADKTRNMLWGMNLDERLLKTGSRYVIPIEEVSFEKSSNGVGVSVKVKRGAALSQSGLTHFELYATEELDSALQAILQTWKTHQITPQAVEGYASKFPAPQLFLDALLVGSSPKGEWNESEVLNDKDYLAHLQPLFKDLSYHVQCRVLSRLRNVSAGELASLLQTQLVASLREKLEKAISEEAGVKESAIWLFRIGVVLLLAYILVLYLSSEDVVFWVNILFGFPFFIWAGGTGLAWIASIVRFGNARKQLQEQDVDPQKLEAELRATAKVIT